ncbi:hypothetical protein AYO44_06375 [Planctomycetaceae bacterium SCGC AG-212-F19]|nr:hypothetical protein AYO44_06375 [Planctomycetaceae bacterium SCGC AG-212-F19]
MLVSRSAQAVVLACSRSVLRPADTVSLQRALEGGIGRDQLLHAAGEHAIVYFVSKHFETAAALISPPLLTISSAVRTGLVEAVRQQSFRALALLAQQSRLAGALDHANIPAVWLKGLALAEQLYRRFEARDCVDLDLLVDERDLGRVGGALAELGFRRSAEPDSHPVSAHHQVWLSGAEQPGAVMVEVHHRLAGPTACQPPAARIIERSRIVSIQGRPFRVPAVEDELFILGLHAHQHHYGMLRCLMDVAEYVTRYGPKIDWERLWRDARTYRCQGRLAAALWVADQVLGGVGAGLTRQAWGALNRVQQWAARAAARPEALFDRAAESHGRRVRLGLLMDRWTDVVRLLGPNVFPPGEYVRTVCPEPWRRWPGVPHLWYLGRIAAKLCGGRQSGAIGESTGRTPTVEPPAPSRSSTSPA